MLFGGLWGSWLRLVLFFLGLTTIPGAALAVPSASVVSEDSPFVCRTWRAEEGLPQESVWAITQTKDGYLWIGTGGGLARFDGVHFEVFGIKDGLPSMQIRGLLEDRTGALWVGTANGVCRYVNGRFTSLDKQAGLPGESIINLVEDRAGSVWIASDLGLSRWRTGRLEQMGGQVGLTNVDVRAMITDRKGNIWVSLVNQGLMRYDGQRFVPAVTDTEFQTLRPYRLLRDQQGNIWAGTVGQIYCIGETNWTKYAAEAGLPEVLITCLAQSQNGTLWAGTSDQGLLYLRDNRFHPVRRTDGLSSDAVRAIMQDAEGNMWVGTRGAGLNRLQPRKLLTRRLFDGGTEVQPVSLVETADGVLWIGTIGHGLYRFKEEQYEVLLREQLLPWNLQVSALLAAEDGSLWGVGGSSLFHWKNGVINLVCPVDGVHCLCEGRDHSIWLGNDKGVLQRFTRGKLEKYTNELRGSEITAMVQAADGTLWVASYSHGLGRLANGEFKLYGRADGLQSDLLRALCLDKDRALWIGTEGGGLSRMEAGKIVSWGNAQGIPDETILQILEDDHGMLWLGTQHGIVRVAKTELDEVATGKRSRVYPRVFGQSDGMLTEQCSGDPETCLQTRRGLLCFSTGRGLVVIDPQLQRDKNTPPVVRLEQVVVDGKPLVLPGEVPSPPLRILPGNQRVEFSFTGLFYSAPERVSVRYRLEGLDRDWNEAGVQRSVYYTHLPAGDYRFVVAAHNGSGNWSSEVASVALTVEPFFWERRLFLITAGLLLAGLIAGSVRYVEKRKAQARLKKLEMAHAMETERARIARDIHDDIGAGLTEIGLTSELFEDPKLSSQEVRQFAREISVRSRELVSGMDEIVWAINPRNDNLKSSVAYFSQYADRFFKPAGISCRMEVQPDLTEFPLSSEQRHNFFLGFKEALNNILKHAAAHEVRMTARMEGNIFVFSVADDGIGFLEKPNDGTHDGLINLRERLAKIGGECEISSEVGRGTKIVFRLPLQEPP